MSAEFRLGIQSYCFRKFETLPDLIGALKQAGLSYVEIWPRHIPADLNKEEQEKALAALTEENITIDSYGQVKFTNDEHKAREAMNFSKIAGIKAVTADVDPDAFQLMEKICDEYDISLAIHNHGKKHRYGNFQQLKEVFSKTSKRFGLCLDTAWLLDAGNDPLEAVEVFKDRIYGVHLKDFSFDEQGNHQDVIIGTGKLDLPEFMKRLKNIDFNGYLSIEYEGDKDDPIPNTVKCVEAVKEVLNGL